MIKHTLLSAAFSLLIATSCFAFGSGAPTIPEQPEPSPSSEISGAGAVIKNPRFFSTVGQLSSFEWAPSWSPTAFRYDILYYIPKNLAAAKQAKTLVFLHGGGGSTMTRDGSRRVVEMYAPDFIQLADQLGFILVLPSGSGLNWCGHERSMLRELNALIRSDLDTDPNAIGLAGHSMGAMGITREFYWLTDDYAFIMPMAGGMQLENQTEEFLNKVFNVQYTHLQGLNDHFTDFVTRTQEQLKRTQALETKYNAKSKLDVQFYPGSHNYDLGLVTGNLNALFKNVRRDLYQRKLWGIFLSANGTLAWNNITFGERPNDRYFWMQAPGFDQTKYDRAPFMAELKADMNMVDVQFQSRPQSLKKIRVNLTAQMLDVTRAVRVVVDGQTASYGLPTAYGTTAADPNDPGYQFTHYIDVSL